MTEFLRELIYPSFAADLTLDELYGRLKPFMYIPRTETPSEADTEKQEHRRTAVSDQVSLEPAVDAPIVSIPPIIVPPTKGFTSILWCAYTVAHGGTELNIPLSLLAREERKIREDCLNRVSPAMVKQRFGFLTLSQIQSLLQEIQKTNKLTCESPATRYIWAVYYANMPRVNLVFGRAFVELAPITAVATTVQILFDKPKGVMRVVHDANVCGLVQITNIVKPLNGIGSYTLFDLKQMATQLELPIMPAAKKTALYENISEYIRTVIA
jgi:hypothetical protein